MKKFYFAINHGFNAGFCCKLLCNRKQQRAE